MRLQDSMPSRHSPGHANFFIGSRIMDSANVRSLLEIQSSFPSQNTKSIEKYLESRKVLGQCKPWFWKEYDRRDVYTCITPDAVTTDVHCPNIIIKKFTPDGQVLLILIKCFCSVIVICMFSIYWHSPWISSNFWCIITIQWVWPQRRNDLIFRFMIFFTLNLILV